MTSSYWVQILVLDSGPQEQLEDEIIFLVEAQSLAVIKGFCGWIFPPIDFLKNRKSENNIGFQLSYHSKWEWACGFILHGIGLCCSFWVDEASQVSNRLALNVTAHPVAIPIPNRAGYSQSQLLWCLKISRGAFQSAGTEKACALRLFPSGRWATCFGQRATLEPSTCKYAVFSVEWNLYFL